MILIFCTKGFKSLEDLHIDVVAIGSSLSRQSLVTALGLNKGPWRLQPDAQNGPPIRPHTAVYLCVWDTMGVRYSVSMQS